MKVCLIISAFLLMSLTVSSQNIDFNALQTEFTADTAYVEQEVRDMIEKIIQPWD